jgi:CheY-like chemotaxis protein
MFGHAYTATTSDSPSNRQGVLRGSRILIVEDEPLMAVDYHFQVQDMGAIPVGYKSTNSDALDFLASHAVDAAIVDYVLSDGKSEPIMRCLLERSIPFVVITANQPEMRQWIGLVPVLDKPVSPLDLHTALFGLLVRRGETARLERNS